MEAIKMKCRNTRLKTDVHGKVVKKTHKVFHEHEVASKYYQLICWLQGNGIAKFIEHCLF